MGGENGLAGWFEEKTRRAEATMRNQLAAFGTVLGCFFSAITVAAPSATEAVSVSVVATQACTTASSRLSASSIPDGMVLIPAGAFIMGDGFSEGSTNEVPTHVVFVSAFCLETNLVSKGLWDQVYQWGKSQ